MDDSLKTPLMCYHIANAIRWDIQVYGSPLRCSALIRRVAYIQEMCATTGAWDITVLPPELGGGGGLYGFTPSREPFDTAFAECMQNEKRN